MGTSKLISDSKVLPLEHYRRPVRLTWLVYSKTPTCALSTPSVSLLCQRTYNLQDESEERELRMFPSCCTSCFYKILIYMYNINTPTNTFRDSPYILTPEQEICIQISLEFHNKKHMMQQSKYRGKCVQI